MNCEHCEIELKAGEVQPSRQPCWYEAGVFDIQHGVKVGVVHTAERCRDRLKAMLADDDRILRSSVPERWKHTTSPVGAVQSYIAELEQRLKTVRTTLAEARYYINSDSEELRALHQRILDTLEENANE